MLGQTEIDNLVDYEQEMDANARYMLVFVKEALKF